MSAKIQVRRDTAANWTAANPVLLRGEIGFEYDTVKVKIGDGTSTWTALAYAVVSQTMVESLIADHADRVDNPHSVSKAQVGLGDVPNVDATLRSNHTGTQTASTISDFSTAVDAVQLSAFVATKEPTGHENRTQSTVDFDEATRTFSISPVSGSFDVWIAGVKQSITTTLSVVIPNISGNYFFYIDSNGDLQYQAAFDISLFEGKVYTGFVHWNATDGEAIVWGEERHGIVMDGATHSYLHTTRGTQLVSGGAITYTGGSGSANSDAQIGLGDLRIRDEDIQVNIAHSSTPSASFQQVLYPIAEMPILYRDGSEWRRSTPSQYPMLTGAARAQFNENTGATWQLTEASANGKVLLTYVFATTDFRTPVFGILGQAEYASVDEAKALGGWDQITFGDLPAQELKLLYIVYYETNSGMTNTPKAGILEVSDARFTLDRQVSASSFNGDHSNLSGLTSDDHLQYLNETRGDIRYYTKAESDGNYEPKDAGIQSHIASTSNPHSVTKDQVGLGSVDNVSAASLRDRSTHTGTQLAATISDFTTAVQSVTIDATQIDGGGVSNTEFSYLANVTSDIQTQLNGKQASGNYITALTGDVTATGPGSATATLANSGVTAGTYDQVTVDTKGRVTAGAVKRYVYSTSVQTTNNTVTYSNVNGLTSATLPAGLYSFRFDGQYQSAATATGVGFRITNGTATVTTMYGKWYNSQAADGTAKSFQIDQQNSTTNVTSASSAAANSNANISGEGIFRVTVAGTVVIQIRSEVAASQVLIQPDAVLVIEQIA